MCLTSLVIYYMHNLSSWVSGIVVGMLLHVDIKWKWNMVFNMLIEKLQDKMIKR